MPVGFVFFVHTNATFSARMRCTGLSNDYKVPHPLYYYPPSKCSGSVERNPYGGCERWFEPTEDFTFCFSFHSSFHRINQHTSPAPPPSPWGLQGTRVRCRLLKPFPSSSTSLRLEARAAPTHPDWCIVALAPSPAVGFAVHLSRMSVCACVCLFCATCAALQRTP